MEQREERPSSLGLSRGAKEEAEGNPAKELTDAVHWAKSDLELFAPTAELHRLIREI